MAEIVGVQDARQVGFWKPVLGLLVVLLTGAIGVHLWVNKLLDTHQVGLQERIADLRERDGQPRPVLWGEPVEGNAAEDYRRAEKAVEDLGILDIADGMKAADAGADLPPAIHPLLDRYGSVLVHVRAGIRKTRCDWRPDYELGGVSRNLIQARQVANVLSLEAYRASDSETALRIAFDTLAYGRDFGQNNGLIGAMIGIAVRAIGVKSLLRTLRRRPLTESQYARILQVVASLEPLDLEPLVDGMWRNSEVWLASLSGRPLDPSYAEKQAEYLKMIGMPGSTTSPAEAYAYHRDSSFSQEARDRIDTLVTRRLAIEIEREWAALDGFRRRSLEVIRLPFPERKAAADALQEDAKGYAIAGALLEERVISNCVADLWALEDMLRVLAAAHLYRLENGSFPSGIAPLEERLEGVPLDPYRKAAPLSIVLQNGVLRVYSWYEDGVDGGGPLPDPGRWRKGGDLTLTTSAPPTAVTPR